MENNTKHRGVEVDLGGTTYIIPPLNFRQLQSLETEINKVSNMAAGGQLSFTDIRMAAPIVLAAIQRNYSEMTADALADVLDLVNVREAFGAALGLSQDMIQSAKDKVRATITGEVKPAFRVQ